MRTHSHCRVQTIAIVCRSSYADLLVSDDLHSHGQIDPGPLGLDGPFVFPEVTARPDGDIGSLRTSRNAHPGQRNHAHDYRENDQLASHRISLWKGRWDGVYMFLSEMLGRAQNLQLMPEGWNECRAARVLAAMGEIPSLQAWSSISFSGTRGKKTYRFQEDPEDSVMGTLYEQSPQGLLRRMLKGPLPGISKMCSCSHQLTLLLSYP